MSINKLATRAGIDWAVLKRFAGKGSKAGISFATFEKLWPFLYGDHRPEARPGKGSPLDEP
jgi:DNA-binding Xre family transcriptional regulator